MSDPGLSCEILRQIEDALHRIERRFSVIVSSDDFRATDDGVISHHYFDLNAGAF